MIEVRNLTKKYGANTAVRDISFTIENGKIYGLLGPNGAGKSTTMNIITGCLAATSGTVLIDGHDIFEEPLEAKKHIGYLPEQPPLYGEMTPSEYLSFVAEAKGVPYDKRRRQIKDVMKLTGIEGVADRLIMNLSKGYKQRVGIAQALIGEPDTIILDEPTVGLDPQQIIEMRQLIRDLGQHQTVIISSHILAEISAVCDHVLIISRGRLLTDSSLEDLEAEAARENGISIKARCGENEVKKILESVSGAEITDMYCSGGITSATVKAPEGRDIREQIFNAFAERRMPLLEMVEKESTLEDIFLSLVGRELGNEAAREDSAPEAPASNDSGSAGFVKEREKDKKTGGGDSDYTPLFGGNSEEDN